MSPRCAPAMDGAKRASRKTAAVQQRSRRRKSVCAWPIDRRRISRGAPSGYTPVGVRGLTRASPSQLRNNGSFYDMLGTQETQPLPHRNAALQQERADLIDDAGALANQSL